MARAEQRHGPGWPAWAGAAILLAAAAVLSFTTLAELAARAGYSDWRRWLIPVVIDAAVLVAVRFWLAAGLVRGATRMGFWLALAMLALSIAGNALEHWLDTGGVLSPVLSTIPPIILGAVGVLVDLGLRVEVDQPARSATEPVVASQPTAVDWSHQFTVTARPAGQPAVVLAIPAVEIAGQPVDPIVEPVSQPDSQPAATLAARLAIATDVPARPPVRTLADRVALWTQIDRPTKALAAGGRWSQHLDRARVVLASQPGIGRPALAAALEIPESQARKLLAFLNAESDQLVLAVAEPTTEEPARA